MRIVVTGPGVFCESREMPLDLEMVCSILGDLTYLNVVDALGVLYHFSEGMLGRCVVSLVFTDEERKAVHTAYPNLSLGEPDAT